jgi:hypothetical protein
MPPFREGGAVLVLIFQISIVKCLVSVIQKFHVFNLLVCDPQMKMNIEKDVYIYEISLTLIQVT